MLDVHPILCRCIFVALITLLACPSLADAEPSKTADEVARRKRLEFMKRTFAEFELFTLADSNRPLERSLSPKPLSGLSGCANPGGCEWSPDWSVAR